MDKLLQLRGALSAFNPAILALSGAPGANYFRLYSGRRWVLSKWAAVVGFVAGWYFYDFTKGMGSALAAVVLVWLVMPTVRSAYKKRQSAMRQAINHVVEIEGAQGVIHEMVALRGTRADLQNREYDRLISLSYDKRVKQMTVQDLEWLILFRQDYLDAINLKLAEVGHH